MGKCKNMLKKEIFEAFVEELLIWNNEYNNKTSNDLSQLKILNLLFLWVSKDIQLLNIFNNFRPWDLWIIEKDIFEWMKGDVFHKYKINTNELIIKNKEIVINNECKIIAKKIINNLKQKNINLIWYTASELVDIIHKWNCWDLSRQFKLKRVNSDLILSEKWYFS